MVPLPCVRTPEQLPVTAMTNAIRLALAPGPRNTGLQILIFEASRQHLSQESRQRTRGNARQQVSQPNMKRDASVLRSSDTTVGKQGMQNTSCGSSGCLRVELCRQTELLRECKMVPLPCVRTPEQPPVTAMTNAIRLALAPVAPGPRNTGLQILIFEASRQHLSQE